MAVTRKIKPTDLQNAINNTLNDIYEPKQEGPAKQDLQPLEPLAKTVEPAKTSTPATAGNDKKTLCNFKVNENTLKAWKQFCLDHDTNLTDTIKRAMNYYIKNVNNGNVDL